MNEEDRPPYEYWLIIGEDCANDRTVASVTTMAAWWAVQRLMAYPDPAPEQPLPFEVDLELYGKIRC